MKAFHVKVRHAGGTAIYTALARNGAEAMMLAWDQFGSEPVQITIKGAV